jgi:hypothetical protein
VRACKQFAIESTGGVLGCLGTWHGTMDNTGNWVYRIFPDPGFPVLQKLMKRCIARVNYVLLRTKKTSLSTDERFCGNEKFWRFIGVQTKQQSV